MDRNFISIMSNPLCTFEADSSIVIPAAPNVMTVTIDPATGEMIVTTPGGSTPFPLIDEENEPLPRAIQVDAELDPVEFQVGSVEYEREGMYVQYFALNEYEITFSVTDSTGPLGVLDLRDFAKQAPPKKYYFDMMPVILSIGGNYLVVKTLEYVNSDSFGPWYE